jgi:hypothetical protein
MKKLILVAVCALVLCFAAGTVFAADTSFGVIGGVGLSKVGGDDVGDSVKSRIGLSGGLFAELPLLNSLVLHPEALFSLKGYAIDGSDDNVNLYYIDVPVLAKFYLPLALPVKTHVFAGPYVGMNIIAKSGDTDIKDLIKTLDYGLVFGGGADISKFLFDIRYEFGLAKIMETDSNVYNRNLALMVGYRFK